MGWMWWCPRQAACASHAHFRWLGERHDSSRACCMQVRGSRKAHLHAGRQSHTLRMGTIAAQGLTGLDSSWASRSSAIFNCSPALAINRSMRACLWVVGSSRRVESLSHELDARGFGARALCSFVLGSR